MIHIDFETFSTAGYRWDPVKEKWTALEGASKSGLPAVGAEVYAMHPSTRVICLAWGDDVPIWRPGAPPPFGLWDHVRGGGLLSAWNSLFERWIWKYCLEPQGWPELPLAQIVDGMPRARAHALPGALGNCAKVLGLAEQKDTGGKTLVRKFCVPRTPTKLDRRVVVLATDEPELARQFEEYCVQDVATETDASRVLPELSPFEQRVWALDQQINVRGIPVDTVAVDHACELLRQAARVLNSELCQLTGGAVELHSQLAKLSTWIGTQGVEMPVMDKAAITAALEADPPPPPQVQRALEIRQALSSTSTKKVWAFRNRSTAAGRIHGQFLYGGAARTLRWSGGGIQPQNFPRGMAGWSLDQTEQFLESIACRDYAVLADRWGDVLKALASSLRGLICASPGHDLIGSDYRAIEAVVLAVVAGEDWRVNVFRERGDIYLSSASKITGNTLAQYAAYDGHHPDRLLGKLAELASGYGGGVGAWIKFGAGKFFTPDRCERYRAEWERYTAPMANEAVALNPGLARRRGMTLQEFAIQKQVWAWRDASPNVVKFWKGLETAAMAAIREPGSLYRFRGIYRFRAISYHMDAGVLYCTLPSGRRLAYHQARIGPGRFGPAVFYHGWNSNPKFGAMGWVELDTYGGKLTENVVQAVARDLLAHGMLSVADAGYSIVMHIHDEIICEEREGHGSVEEIERLMGIMPDWAKDWPVRAAGGWRGKRFRK